MSIPNFPISMPLMLNRDPETWAGYVRLCKRLDVDRVFLCGLSSYHNPAAMKSDMRARIAYLAGEGLKAGAWVAPTLGHGGGMTHDAVPFQQIEDRAGRPNTGVACPLDERFAEDLASQLVACADAGADMILLEDDFRLHLHEHAFGCFCPLHLARFAKETGSAATREEIAKAVLEGEPNELRAAWQKLAGQSLVELAGKLERAVHARNADCRLGFATVMTQYSGEGCDIRDLVTALSGDTKPFARGIGAPYWDENAFHPAWAVEYHRLQQHWFSALDIDLMAEGDTCPHTSYRLPASTVTAFTQGLIAAGYPGMLFYAEAYELPPDRDPVYADRFERDLPYFKMLAKFFPPEAADLGVTPVETLNNYENLTLPVPERRLPVLTWPDEPSAPHVLARMGIPMTYGSETAPVVLFGYGARGLPDERVAELLSRGALIDGVAAKWLTERGFDVGVTGVTPAEDWPAAERFDDRDVYGKHCGDGLGMFNCTRDMFFRVEPKPGARVLSWYTRGDRDMFPSCLHYESAAGRVCVLPINTRRMMDAPHTSALYGYARQTQLAASLEWVARRPLDVFVADAPNVHLIARRTAAHTSVLIQNCWADELENPLLVFPPDAALGDPLILCHEARRAINTARVDIWRDSAHAYMRLHITIPPHGAAAVRVEN